LVATIVLGYVLEWDWTGLVKDKAYTKRTLWDWLQLLIIPAVLAGVGLWFNRQQREQELQTADSRAQDEALQAYLDQMSDMLIPNNDQPSLSDEHPPESLKTVARARTLTVLPRLDSGRKARVVQFLHESGLIHRDRAVIDLSGADLRETDLREANLRGANLRGTDLRGTDLRGTDLRETDLSRTDLRRTSLDRTDLAGANLREANLSRANLHETDLSRAHLSRADLSQANLGGANLSRADLGGADLSQANLSDANLSRVYLGGADLSWAHLNDARGWTWGRLSSTESLKHATMPDGQYYEDWLKNKGRKEAQENSGP